MASLIKSGAVLLCTLLAASACAQDLGRLFTTPEQRSALQRLRYAGPTAGRPAASGAVQATAPLSAASTPGGAASAAPTPTPYPAAQGDQVMVINGIVRRSGPGRNTTWIDSVPYSGNTRVAGGVALARGASNASIALTLRSGRQVDVKAGQHVNARSGRIGESYQEFPAPAVRKSEPEAVPE